MAGTVVAPGPGMLQTPSHPSPPDVGQVLDGRFRLLQVVQRDRAGMVFDALDEVTAEVVRLRITVGAVDPERLGILHPGLARPLAVSADGSYIVLQDLDDEPLEPALFPSLDRLAQLTDAILPTLAALHAHGVVHGELQPTSFWLDRHGEVRLVDLGLAVTLGRSRDTEPYVAPERAFGRADDDPRSDVYSLAAVLFHLATGATPSPAALEQADLPEPLRQVFALALDPRPLFRPHNAGALHRALQEALERTGHLPDVPDEPDGTFDEPCPPTLPPVRRRLCGPIAAERQAQNLLESALLPWWTALLLVGGLSFLMGTVILLAAVALGSATLL